MTEEGQLPERPGQEQRHIALQLEADKAFEIRLLREDGSDSATTVMVGSSLHLAAVTFSPGTYVVQLRSLTEASASAIRKEVSIGRKTETLDLVELLRDRSHGSETPVPQDQKVKQTHFLEDLRHIETRDPRNWNGRASLD